METVAAFEMDAITSLSFSMPAMSVLMRMSMPRLRIASAKPVAQIGIEIAQDLIAAMDHGDLHAEPGEDRGELHADIARADDGDARRQLFELKAFVGADQMLASLAALGIIGWPPVATRMVLALIGASPFGEPHRVRIIEHGAVMKMMRTPAFSSVRV